MRILITLQDLRKFVDYASDEDTRSIIQSYLDISYKTEVLAKRITILDLLETHPTIQLPFAELLSMLPPMRTRFYSISSSPLANPAQCTITCAIIEAPARSGEGRFSGVTSSYFKSLNPGDAIQVAVRSTSKSFRLPLQVEKTPIIMYCAGTGLAPFRGFVQQRVELIKAGKEQLAPAILFMGCRSSDRDRLYAEELDAWSALGAVDIRYAFSHEPDDPRAQGCKYVQDRVFKSRADLYDLWEKGAKIYICGSPGMAEAVTVAAKQLVRESLAADGKVVEDEELNNWFLQQKGERFVTDIFN